ncbi:MAG: hypothetical protein AAFV93_15175 [Chloroflexota bacterium]
MSERKQSIKAEHVSGAIFMIGLGLLFVTGWWFPGILFVIGASTMASALVDNHPWQSATGALWMFGIGVIFWLNLPWGVVLILIGISYLFSTQYGDNNKRKNDEKAKNDDIDFV